MADALAITPHASASRTATGQSTPAVDMGALRTAARLELIVTVVTGTNPTLKVSVQTSPNGTSAWRTVDSFKQIGASGSQKLTVGDMDQWIRVAFTIGGTLPDFTFSVAGEAHVTYADPADLSKTSINEKALKGIAAEVLADCCLRATDNAETSLNAAYTLPLTAWGDDLRGVTADRAMFYAMNHRGFAPDNATDVLIIMAGGIILEEGSRSAAERWFDSLATGGKKPIGIVDSTPEVFEAAQAVVSSAVVRGW